MPIVEQDGQTTHAARRAVRWAVGFVLIIALTLGLESLMSNAWTAFSRRWGVGAAFGASVVGLALLSLVAALVEGRIALPAREARRRIVWLTHMCPFYLRDGLGLRGVASGRHNTRWDSVAAFEADDHARRPGPEKGEQADFGAHWIDRGRYAGRVTYIAATREVIVVSKQPENERVELIGAVRSMREAEARLSDWAYASMGGRDLRWVRQRLHGWDVPLPPRGGWWRERDAAPLRPWPSPPEPSVGRAAGAYHGSRHDHEYHVLQVDEEGERPLYHAVEHSPTGYAWGYSGAGPSDLAQSILLDRLGYLPQPRIVFTFRDEIIARLEEAFVLSYRKVDTWVDDHASWFAENPRAVPLDLYAAGGADDEP